MNAGCNKDDLHEYTNGEKVEESAEVKKCDG